MKQAKSLIVVLLLAALLLSGCGQTAAPAAPEAPTAAPQEAAPQEPAPAEAAAPVEEESPAVFHAKSLAAGPTYAGNPPFQAKFEGDAVVGSGEVVDGVYRFSAAQTDGEAWHVKLESNYPTVAGRDYRVTYRFTSDVAGKVKFGDFQEFDIKKGDNAVTGILIAEGGTSYLDLQLGMLPPFTIDFTEIEVEEYADEVDYEDALPVTVDFEDETRVYEKHDQGYGVLFERNADAVALQYVATSWDTGIWKSRLYIKTGFVPDTGARYHITADVMCDQDMPFEVLFNDADVEKGYGALYGQNLVANEVTGCEAVITGSSEGEELVIQFSLGEVPEGATVTVGNLRVEKVTDHYTNVLPYGFALDKEQATGKMITEAVPESTVRLPMSYFTYSGVDSVYEGHDDGYLVRLDESADSAVMDIYQAPAADKDRGVWKAKLYVDTGFTPEAGKTYRLMFDLVPEKDQAEYEVCLDGNTENAYGALYGRSLTAATADHVACVIAPEESAGPLTIRLQLGKTDTAAGNKVTLKNLSLEELPVEYNNVLPADFSYNTPAEAQPEGDTEYVSVLPESFSYRSGVNVYEQHDEGYEQSVSAESDSASLSISAIPAEANLWRSKLFVATGVTPEAGKHYRVSALVAADKALDYEIVCDNGGTENGYEGKTGSHVDAGGSDTVTADFIAPASGCGELVLRFQLGNSPADNTITVSDIQVREVSSGSSEPVTPPEGDKGSFDLQCEANTPAAAELSGDGSSATATVTTPSDDWHIKFYAKPGLSLEAGKSYRVSLDVANAEGCEVCFKNTESGDETGFGAAKVSGGKISHEINADASAGMEILLKIGNVPAGTKVTVSNVKIEEGTMAATDVTPKDFAYPVTSEASSTVVPEAWVAQPISLSASDVAYDGIEQNSSVENGAVTLYVSQGRNGGGLWSSRLYVDTGVVPEQGARYRVTASFQSSQANEEFELLYSNGIDENDSYNPGGKGYSVRDGGDACFYGQSIGAGETRSYQQELVIPARDTYNSLVLRFQLGNSPTDTTVTVKDITVEKLVPEHEETSGGSTEANSFDLQCEANTPAAAELTGDGSSATATVTTPSDDWHIKFYAKPGLSLEAGKSYRVSLDVANAEGCEVCFKNTGTGDEKGFGATAVSGGKISHEINAEASAGMEILLKIGAVPAGTKVTVSNVKIEELSGGYSDITPEGFAYPNIEESSPSEDSETLGENLMTDALCAWAPVHHWADAGYDAALSNTDTSASLAISAVAAEQADWKLKLFVETGAPLESGKSYRIRYDLTADTAFDYNVFYNNGAEEKAVGEFYGLNTGTASVEHVVTPKSDAVLNIQLMLGNSPAANRVTVSNVQVEEIRSGAAPSSDDAPIHVWTHETYTASLTNTDSSASLAIRSVPATEREAWKVKLFAETGAALKAGRTYRIRLAVQADKPLDYEICYNNGAEEKALGAQYDLSASETAQTVSCLVTPAADATMTLQLNLGKAEAARTVTIRDIQVEDVVLGTGSTVIPSFRYDSVGYFSSAADQGYITSLEQSSSAATFRILQAPEERNPWNAKLYIKTGVTPTAGKGYQVSFDIESAKPQGLFEAFYDGNAESCYGAQYAESLPAGKKAFSYVVRPGDSRGELVLQLRFGQTNGTDGNSYTISNLKIDEISYRYMQTPEKKETTTLWTHDTYGAVLEKTPERATVRMEKTPAEGMEPWKTKLFVETGVKLKAGQKYRISMDVKSIIPTPFEICFNNGEEEKGLGAVFGLLATPYGQPVAYTTYVKQDTQLVIQLSLGNCAAPNSIILSGVKVEKAGAIEKVSDTIYTF